MLLSLNFNKFLRGLLLVAITLFMFHLLKTGGIYLLVSPLIAKIMIFSVLPFGIISLLTLIYSFSPRKNRGDHHHDHDCFHNDNHFHELDDHHHDHIEDGHNHANPKSFWSRMTFALLTVSMFVAFLWHPVALGTNMIGNQSQVSHKPNKTISSGTSSSSVKPATSVYDLQQQTPSSGSAGMIKQSGKNSEAYIAFNYAQAPSKFIGKNEALEGFVYHPVGLPSHYFILTRFYIFCCIADASPIGIAVKSNEATQLKNNTWVNVSGTIQTQNLPILSKLEPTQNWVPSDKNKPVLISKSLHTIPTPVKPYAIPNF